MTTRTPTASKTPAARTQTRKATSQGATRRGAPAAAKATAKTAAKPARRSTAGSAETESPILPVEQLEALRKIKPGAVDWVIEQTQVEAEHRRAEQVRVNNLIFVEHMFAQAAALIVGVSGIGGGVWLAVRGLPWVGVAIIALVMTALAVAQVAARPKRQ